MAMPQELLYDLARLEGEVARVASAVDEVRSQIEGARTRVNLDEVLAGLESSVDSWLSRTADLEARLLHHVLEDSTDADAVMARLGALALLHTAVASDLAVLYPLDDVDEGALARHAMHRPRRAYESTIRDAAFGEGRLISALCTPDDEDSNDDAAVEPAQDEDVDAIVKDLVERAGRSGTAVLGGLAEGAGRLVFGELSPHLRRAAGLAPTELRAAVQRLTGHISRLIGRVLIRIDSIWSTVLGSYRPAVDAVIKAVDPASLVLETLAGEVVGRIMRAEQVRTVAAAALEGAADRPARVRRIRALSKKHHRWVGPVRVVARGIPHLWAVPIGPLPAAPVAAVGLLAWTFLVTGDQLDAPGPYPRVWTGVVGYAQGLT